MTGQIWARLQLLWAMGAGLMTTQRKVQVTILDDADIPPDISRVEPYGLSYRPPGPGFQAYLAFPSGDRARGFALILGDRRYELELLPGEVALHDDQGQKIHIKRDKILIETPLNFEVRAANIKLHASQSYQFDVNGQGQKWDGQGVETWQDNDVARPHHNHAPPEI